MTDKKDNPPQCPVGEPSCQWLDEISQLKLRIDELSELVATDPLTGLANFRQFSAILKREMQRTLRNFQPTSMIMLDIDHFKAVNDKWGHEIGNQTLQLLAKVMNSQVRITDIVCRYGGEEFTIILPETSLKQAVEIAERLRKAIAESPVVFDEGQFNFTVSLGVDIFQSGQSLSPEAFTASVDQYLYQAKETGRNKVCHKAFSELRENTEVSQDEKDMLLG